MAVFASPAFDAHEEVSFVCDPATGLQAIIAVHNTNRGPALGGCRMWPYPSSHDALTDVLRLARGMTYKAALAGLELGGGKSVIIGDPRIGKTEALLLAMGRAVDGLGGRYIAAEDSGTTVADMMVMRRATAHVAGVVEKATGDGSMRSGDPSPATAHGTMVGLRAAVKHRLGRDDLEGLRVAIQGVGSVGFRLAGLLAAEGARLWVSDIHDTAVQRCVEAYGATAVDADAIFDLEVDVLAPCAMGAVINDATVPRLRTAVIAGAANNQLADDRHGAMLAGRGILYAPDYVVNAGGIIDISFERGGGFDRDAALVRLEGIFDTLTEIFHRAEAAGLPTHVVADRLAEERFRRR